MFHGNEESNINFQIRLLVMDHGPYKYLYDNEVGAQVTDRNTTHEDMNEDKDGIRLF